MPDVIRKQLKPGGGKPRSKENALTPAERRALVDWFLAKYGIAEKLFISKCSRFNKVLIEKGYAGDISGQCYLGLVRAAELFDPARGVQFDTFCLPHQYSRCQRLLDHEEKVTRQLRGRRNDGGRAVDDSAASYDPSSSRSRESLAAIRDGVGRVLVQRVPDRRYREIFAMRHGLNGGKVTPLHVVGKAFGISKERVRQIEGKVLAKVRDELEELFLDHCC